ncbi:hypothetical protein Tco_0395672 [Tanacetum coccineum]
MTIEDQDLQKEFENLMLQEINAHTHMENQGIASEKRKEKGKEIYDLLDSDDDLPKDEFFHGNSFDDENKDTEEEIDLDLNNMDNTIDVSSSLTPRIHKNHPQITPCLSKGTEKILCWFKSMWMILSLDPLRHPWLRNLKS